MDELSRAFEYASAVGVSDRALAVLVRAHADEVRFRQDNGNVALVHPETGAAYDAPPSSVEQYELAGWKRKDTPAADETPTPKGKEKP